MLPTDAVQSPVPRIFVTPSGEVWSMAKYPRLLKPSRTRAGYLVLRIWADREYHMWFVHRLICWTFHGPPPADKPQVRHLDGNPENNAADNLAWGDAYENALDRERHGRQRHKLKFADKLEIACSSESTRTLAERFGITRSTVQGYKKRRKRFQDLHRTAKGATNPV